MTKPSNITSIETHTGIAWEEWVEWLRKHEADKQEHSQIAKLIEQRLETAKVESPGWWSQNITVAYEQHIGRRVPGQRADGTFEISSSKTIAGDKNAVFDTLIKKLNQLTSFNQVEIQNSRTSITPVRSYWKCDLVNGTKLTWSVEQKTEEKSLVVVTQANLASSETASQWRSFWQDFIQQIS